MTKSIYIIKNKINNKVYVGQAKDPHRRFIQHLCNGNRLLDKLPIHLAIHKYGKENFYYEILESNIEDYNEKEQYYIQKYNSIAPSGYNLSLGGEGSLVGRGKSKRASISIEVADNILNELKESSLTQREIASRNGTTERIVNSINKGESWKIDGEEYPIRSPFSHFSKSTEKEIIWLLENSLASFSSIANYYNLTKGTINQINQGQIHHIPDITYPIRKQTGKTVNIKCIFNKIQQNDLNKDVTK